MFHLVQAFIKRWLGTVDVTMTCTKDIAWVPDFQILLRASSLLRSMETWACTKFACDALLAMGTKSTMGSGAVFIQHQGPRRAQADKAFVWPNTVCQSTQSTFLGGGEEHFVRDEQRSWQMFDWHFLLFFWESADDTCVDYSRSHQACERFFDATQKDSNNLSNKTKDSNGFLGDLNPEAYIV